MNIFLLLVTIFVVLVIGVLIFSLFKSEGKKININSNGETITLKNLKLPKRITRMDYSFLSSTCKIIFDSYKALDYCNKSSNAFDKMEWHTWQVSILIAFLSVYERFVIPYDKNIFHSVILDLTDSEIDNEMQNIFEKYYYKVNIDRSRDDLSRDIIWTAWEVSIILYCIMNNKKY